MNRIKETRKLVGLTQEQMAKKLHISQGTYSQWESGNTKIDSESLSRIAELLNVSADYLLGRKAEKPWIPVLGSVAAGIPISAVEDIQDEWEQIDVDSPDEYFALRIKGDSMEPRIKSGDVVIVRKQAYVETNEIAVVQVDNETATVKRVRKTDQGIWLISDNLAFPPLFFSKDEAEQKRVQVIGKVVELRAKF